MDAEQQFGRRAPLEVEIGSGKGLFLLRAAKQFPEHDFLGIELAGKYARFAAARLAQASVLNALVAHGDATGGCLRAVARGQRWHAVHVYFPDPWWKKRHQKRRIMNDQIPEPTSNESFAPGGRLHFWTDVEEYFELSLARSRRLLRWSGRLLSPNSRPTTTLDYRTHFERRMRLAGLPVYRSEFVKE